MVLDCDDYQARDQYCRLVRVLLPGYSVYQQLPVLTEYDFAVTLIVKRVASNNNLNSIKDIIEKQYSGKHLELDLPKKFLEKYENLSTRLHFDFYEKEYS